jgi:hypothetical protein
LKAFKAEKLRKPQKSSQTSFLGQSTEVVNFIIDGKPSPFLYSVGTSSHR